MNRLKFFLITLISVISFACQAGITESVAFLETSDIQLGAPPLEVTDPYVTMTTSTTEPDFVLNRAATVSLIYGRENRNDVPGQYWDCTILYNLSYLGNSGNLPIEPGELKISHQENDGIYEAMNKHVHSDMGGKVSITITDIIGPNGNSVAGLPTDIRLELKIITEFYQFLEPTQQINDLTITSVPNGHDLNITWSQVDGAEEYELQWGFLDAETITFPGEEEIFANGGSVVLTKSIYEFATIYPEGTIYFRIRPLGRFIRDVNENYAHIKYGPWSQAQNTGILPGFEPTNNWQYSITFAEEGKNKKVINYFDDGLKSRQTQTNLNTEKNTLTAESVYDVEGRPTVSILPSIDASNNNDLFFKPSLNTATNQPFNALHFDKSKNSVDKSVSPLDNTNGASWYFSSANNLENIHNDLIPDAEGYPLTQVEFTYDGTGRVRYQGGVGSQYQIYNTDTGPLTELQGHATRYYYGSANETELRRMFGSRVGEASHYKKNMVVDANGQVSISYLDQSGKIIATALGGTSPGNVIDLDDSLLEGLAPYSLNSNNTVYKEDKVSINKSVILNSSVNNQVTFTYNLDKGINFLESNTNTCQSCEYELHIWITNSYNDRLDDLDCIGGCPNAMANPTDEIIVPIEPPASPNCAGTTSYVGNDVVFKTTFSKIGEYTVYKELRLVEGSVEYWMDNIGLTVIELELMIKDLQNQYEAEIDYSSCDVTCEQEARTECGGANNQCYNDYLLACYLESYEDYVDDLNNPFDINQNDPLTAPPNCKMIILQIDAQINPGGYLHGDDTFLELVLDNGSYTTNNGVTVTNANEIRDEWASSSVEFLEILRPEHREYCHFEFCVQEDTRQGEIWNTELSRASGLWQLDPNVTNTHWQQAVSEGLIVDNQVLQTINLDPFFSNSQYSGIKDELEDLMNNFGAGNPPDGPFSCPSLTFYSGFTIFDVLSCPDFYGTTAVDPNKKWDTYQALYIALKKEAQAKYLEEEGCEFRDDVNTIVHKPYSETSADGVAQEQDFLDEGLPQLTEHCNDMCQGKIVNWMYRIEQVCPNIIASDLALIRQNLMGYCQSTCLDLSNPLAVIPSNEFPSGPNYPPTNAYLIAANNIITDPNSGYNCQYTYYDDDGVEHIEDVTIGILMDEVTYEPGPAVPSNITCDFCDVLASFIDEGEWIHDITPDGTVISSEWIPGTWNLAGLEAYYGEHFTLTQIAEAIEHCISLNIGAFPVINDGYQNVQWASDSNPLTPPYNYFLNLLGCNAQTNLGDFQNLQICACEKIFNAYEEVSPGVLELNIQAFNQEYSTNITENEFHIFSSALNSGQMDCLQFYGIQYSLPTVQIPTGEPEISVVDVPCNWNPMVPTSDINADPIDWTAIKQNCIDQLQVEANQDAQDAFDDIIDGLLTAYLNQLNQCFDEPFNENFTYSYNNREHHYTLYYYDQAGNLVQTIPPKGVNLVDAFNNSGNWNGTEPIHRFKTRYRYNTLGQVIWQASPDGGVTEFYYDDIQRLRFSQNNQQASDGAYSYTKYDNQSRIIEVGQIKNISISELTDPANLNNSFYPDMPSGPYEYSDQTFTQYDEATNGTLTQKNLRGRVAQTRNKEIRTSYDYDEHGNVRKLQHYVPEIDFTAQLEYDYDLISGNVKEAIYQRDQKDEFRHRYQYDADNRLTHVYTSEKGYVWDQDARYFYYAHGPLARVEVGHDQVQGLDYWYTLQGWIKGVNKLGVDGMQQDYEPGQDGSLSPQNLPGTAVININKFFGRDEMSYLLGYNSNDYKEIGTINMPNSLNGFEDDMYNSPEILQDGLYNGNIALMSTYIPELLRQNPKANELVANAYQYDQLHRIKQARSTSYDLTKQQWAFDNQFNTDYSYDANGNLRTLDRTANSKVIDELQYSYQYDGLSNTSSTIWQNRLESVEDIIPGSTVGDITSQPGNNYQYDKIGNLIADASENIENIEWSVYGKVKKVNYNATGLQAGRSHINFTYDAAGNRLKKHLENSNNTTTYYIRDASGNIMSTYEYTDADYSGISVKNLYQKETPLYGSSRIGLQTYQNKLIDREIIYSPNPHGPIIIGNRILQDLVIGELQYDSPLTPPNSTEVHLGEFLTLYNRGVTGLPLENVELYSQNNPTDRVSFPAGMTIDPKQTVLIAYGQPSDESDFLLANNLDPQELTNPDSVLWYWQTSLKLRDFQDAILLSNLVPSINNGNDDQLAIFDHFDYLKDSSDDYYNEYYDLSLNSVTSIRPTVNSLRRHYTFNSQPATDYSNLNLQYEEALQHLSQFPFDDPSEQINLAIQKNIGAHSVQIAKGKTILTEENGVSLKTPATRLSEFKRERGLKAYELSNHLLNVLVTVSDKLKGVPGGHTGLTAVYYEADVKSASDYYPFGWAMPGRKYQEGDYRFGFNGQEQDTEWRGGQAVNFKYRVHDPRIAKFLSVDPLAPEYPWYTPYQFAGNSPIKFIELEGLEPENNPADYQGTAQQNGIMMISKIKSYSGQSEIMKNSSTHFSKRVLNGYSEKSDKSSDKTGADGIGYIKDTNRKDAERSNLYTSNDWIYNVDESNASDFNDYEAFVVNKLLENFKSGFGAENYSFPENGIISSQFLDSDILRKALNSYNKQEVAPGQTENFRLSFWNLGGDTYRNGTVFNITGLVGSGNVTITPTEEGLKIQIFNITSLTSGSFGKEVFPRSYHPKSYVREDVERTPYGNISQTYNLFIPVENNK